ncbi:MAG TPA: T9SS type A sorting domain-containing protein [Verrucomicrobiae bacterium]|nr:T9SS type A sorting domain-containing protein [Verrucomicrobiae bacterium]
MVIEHKAQLEFLGDLNGDGNSDYAMRETNQKYRMSIYFGGSALDTIHDGSVMGEILDEFSDCYGCQISAGKWANPTDKQIVVGTTQPRYDSLRFYFYNVREGVIDSIPLLRWDVRKRYGIGDQRMQFLDDINGDGFDDLAHALPGGTDTSIGIVNIHLGGTSLDTIPDIILRPPPNLTGLAAAHFGENVTPVGDLNNDGFSEFVVGVGRTPFTYFGGSPLDTLPRFKLDRIADHFVNGGDINHDGYNDLLVGRDDHPLTGSVYVYFGGVAMDSVMDLYISEFDLRYPSDGFGQTVAGLGDIDGDGTNDFAVGSRNSTFDDQDRGYLYLFKGFSSSTGLEDANSRIPRDFELMQNYPNPFNSSTVIQYSLSKRAQISIEILNITGQRVRVLEEREHAAGTYKVNWDGKDFLGKPVSSGVYLYRLKVGEEVTTKKMMLVR